MSIQNIRSFLEPADLLIDGDISILIGPNGGGKTNLLDAITTGLRGHLLHSWIPRKSPTPDIPEHHVLVLNDLFSSPLERHTQGDGREQFLELELEVTARDVANMNELHTSAHELTISNERKYSGITIRQAERWDMSRLSEGQRFTYRIVNNVLQGNSNSESDFFREYLDLYEQDTRLRDELGREPLSTPMLSLPANRSAVAFQSTISLATFDEFQSKRTADAATSRTGGSVFSLAIGRIARQFRLLLEKDSGTARKDFREYPQQKSLTSILGSLGYEWELISTDAITNQYDIRLTKQGNTFFVSRASSGEKELLTYVFAIFALNVKDALIIVDEPELHLHPNWQTSLFTLFDRLSRETGNQFLLATHSPVFISPASIKYVSRVFSDKQRSKIIRLKNDALPDERHLFAIVNSQNNEKMFFADKVVLVEGPSDRLFFDAVFRKLGVYNGSLHTCEIVSVGGKGYFDPYKALLDACRVPFALIADRDYINEVGTPEIKALFAVNGKDIHQDICDDPFSKDGDLFLARMDEAISSRTVTGEFLKMWDYIKGRRRRIRNDLDPEKEKLLLTFIESKRKERTFILAKGALESYLPEGYRSKDLDKVIRLVNSDFWSLLAQDVKDELCLITNEIKQL